MTVVLGDQQPRRTRRRTVSGDGSLHSTLHHLDPTTAAAQANQQEHTRSSSSRAASPSASVRGGG